jgi:TonB family protein
VLIAFAFAPPKPPETEEGILVNFGTDEVGTGLIEPSPPPSKVEASPPPAARPVKVQNDEPILTQNNEEAPEVKKVDPEAEKKRLEKIEADRKIREQIEADRKAREQAELERKRIEAEQKKIADAKNLVRNGLAGSKAAGTDSKGEGEGGGPGNQGDPNGSVDSKVRGTGSGTGTSGNAVSYNLGGRGFKSLPTPKYDYQEEGIVVVEVSVDRSGSVIQAVAGTKGSTTLNEYLLKVAKEAAMKAKFDPKPDAPVIQKGTIIYRFKLN